MCVIKFIIPGTFYPVLWPLPKRKGNRYRIKQIIRNSVNHLNMDINTLTKYVSILNVIDVKASRGPEVKLFKPEMFIMSDECMV